MEVKTAYELGKEYNERGWENIILPRIERMLEMTEHVYEWEMDIVEGSIFRYVDGYIEFLDFGEAQRRINATLRLSAEDARETEKEIRGACPAKDLFPKWNRRCDALRAYADTLEDK